jgi:8-oxo-dGTP pyrophosphatase MutT (NUDIX family)
VAEVLPSAIEIERSITAKVLLFDSEWRLLVPRRTNRVGHRRGGGLDLIGGRVEEGETPAEAATREAWEEVGVRLNPQKLVQVYEGDLVIEKPHKRVEITWIGYVALLPKGQEPQLRPDENGEYEHDELLRMHLPEFAEASDYARHLEIAHMIGASGMTHESMMLAA